MEGGGRQGELFKSPAGTATDRRDFRDLFQRHLERWTGKSEQVTITNDRAASRAVADEDKRVKERVYAEIAFDGSFTPD